MVQPRVGPVLPLAHLPVGQPGTILSVSGDEGVLQRLSALGIGQGKTISVLRRAWWAGPLHLRVGMTELMLRRRDALAIRIQPCVAAASTPAAPVADGAPESAPLCQGAS
jgi:ferrous iron transport protein A